MVSKLGQGNQKGRNDFYGQVIVSSKAKKSMCGICGILDESRLNSIDRMVSAMHHRGPDDSGIYQEDGIALGMTRLAVIDLSPNAHQPMSNLDRTVWIVYNGETYNFREERSILIKRGHSFKSTSDTEVVLKMYEEYGDDFLLRMRGMFALAIYDKRKGPGKKRLLLARDYLGIKPLLYARVGAMFLFSSEMKAMLASGLIDRTFDPEGLRLLMRYGSIPQPMSAIPGVRMLLPGHRLIAESGTERIERFWKLRTDTISDLRRMAYEDQVNVLRTSLEESVRMQMVSDVPIGAFLSGGVDSSLLVALMKRVGGSKVKTFSVGFGAEGVAIDETNEANRIANFLGTDHTRVLITGKDFREKVTHIASALDQPSVNGVNSYFISLAARSAVTVAISGTGGDELFAGYPWFMNMVAYTNVSGRNAWRAGLKRMLSYVTRHRIFNPLLGTQFGEVVDSTRAFSNFLTLYARQYQLFGVNGACRIISPAMKRLALMSREPSEDIAFSDELPLGSPIERVSALCLRGYTQNQLLRDIDAVSMAHSLEVRVPFLDPLVIDAALSLPDDTKLGDISGITNFGEATYRETGAKRILIDIGRDLLPVGMDLQGKRGFGMPFDSWLRGSLRDILEEILSSASVTRRGYFDVNQVRVIKKKFLCGKISWVLPWLLIITELWCREVLDKRMERTLHCRECIRNVT